MKYAHVVNSPALRDYFGKRSTQWILELNTLINKSGIRESEVTDKNAENKLRTTQKWSWLGFFFFYYWAAYHNSVYWLQLVIFMSVLNTIDMLFFSGVFSAGIAIAPGVYLGFFGKSLLLTAKAKELDETGNLTSPSWVRVIIAFVVFNTPIILTVLFLEL